MNFLEKVKNEPALISALLLALFNIFALDPEKSGQIIAIVSAVLPLVLGLLVRQNVDGPVTADKKAEALAKAKRANSL